VYPGNRNVYYAFDSLNRLTNVTDWANRQTMIGYDLASRVTSITRPNGTVRKINYDVAGQTTSIVEQLTNGAPIAFSRLNWDNAARVQWEFAAPLPHTNTAPPTRTMTFDDDNHLETFNGNPVTNDLDGNMTGGPLTNATFATYTYDARNRLTQTLNSQQSTLNYSYDPAGNRIAMTNGANVTRYVVNPNAKLPQVLMLIQNGITNYYIYGQGLLYQITETATATNTLTYHFDYRGSTIALTDKNGNVTDRIEYSAYGLTTCRGGTNDTPFLYNGRYGVMTDPNGLLYMRARYYNPYICRFINPDPSGFAGGLNWYAYADGNPISLMDPFGLGTRESSFSWLGAWNTTAGLLIPGANSAQNAYTSFARGDYANGTASAVSSVGEAVIGALMYAENAANSTITQVGNSVRSLLLKQSTATDTTDALVTSSKWDISGGLKAINTDVTADEFAANLQANGYAAKTTMGNNGPVTVLNNGQGSTYTIYTRTSTGGSGVQYIGPNGQFLKYNLRK
jgi:RHS repeat-associated protein